MRTFATVEECQQRTIFMQLRGPVPFVLEYISMLIPSRLSKPCHVFRIYLVTSILRRKQQPTVTLSFFARYKPHYFILLGQIRSPMKIRWLCKIYGRRGNVFYFVQDLNLCDQKEILIVYLGLTHQRQVNMRFRRARNSQHGILDTIVEMKDKPSKNIAFDSYPFLRATVTFMTKIPLTVTHENWNSETSKKYATIDTIMAYLIPSPFRI